ncbi:MAG TPA: thermonuclease family protein [Candidatus Limnocylindria bacterium]|nr:thermonuclease family protein [Candidatus Limnocylindria bacterium]
MTPIARRRIPIAAAPVFRCVKLVLAVSLAAVLGAGSSASQTSQPTRASSESGPRSERRPQPRPHGSKVTVAPEQVEVDDGDTAVIRWSASDAETVRFLGIDTPETRHVPHDLPYAQPFGPEARAFGQGAFAAATRIELLRSSSLDPYRRTLAYFFLNGKNYSVLVVEARLAEESISRYGDNGLKQEAADVLAAAKRTGPLPFESPSDYRKRMRDVSRWMKDRGMSPEQ